MRDFFRIKQKIGAVSAPTLLQIVPSLAYGGLARATLDAAQAIIAAGGNAIVASSGGALVPDLLRLRASHLELPDIANPLWARLTLPAKLATSLRDVEVDLIQARSPTTGWIAAALARRLDRKWIATLHRPGRAPGIAGRLAERRIARTDSLIAVSDIVSRAARDRFPDLGDRLEVIAPGINFDRFDPALVRADRVIRLASELRVPDGRLVVLCPATFSEDRGQRLLVEAIRLLGREDVFCLLLGSTGIATPFEKELEAAIAAAGLQGRMQIGPYVDDMPAAYMLADVVVSTAGAGQGFSRALVEAQAMGRPVVATAGGGAAEAIQPGVTGWLAEPDSASALADALGNALALDTHGRADLARRGQEEMRRHYNIARSSERLVALYRRLVG